MTIPPWSSLLPDLISSSVSPIFSNRLQQTKTQIRPYILEYKRGNCIKRYGGNTGAGTYVLIGNFDLSKISYYN